MTVTKTKTLSNLEIVTLAVHLLGGATQRVDAEDIAFKVNEIAPGRFTWRKYKEQISLEAVRKRLWDATLEKTGAYLYGNDREGWMLTPSGLKFAKTNQLFLKKFDLQREPLNLKERKRLSRERERMLTSDAYTKFAAGQSDAISSQETESFFRVDAYVTGSARTEKILRAKTLFGEDKELGSLIALLEIKLIKGKLDEHNTKVSC
jgi:hypothetical protein